MEIQHRTPRDVSDGVEASRVTNRPCELTDLPFVRADGRGVLCYWSVTPTGNDSADLARSFEWGRQLVAFMDQIEDHPQILTCVIRDMVAAGRFGPLESGFIQAVGTATVELHNALRLGLVQPGLFGRPIVYLGYVAPKHGHYDRPPGQVNVQDLTEID